MSVPSAPYSGGRCPTPAATQSVEKEPRSFPLPSSVRGHELGRQGAYSHSIAQKNWP